MTRKESIELTKHPGKFEGCANFVPYYWELVLNGGADSVIYNNNSPIDVFKLGPTDYDLWPDLNGYDCLELWEDNNGFVRMRLS